MILRSLRSLPTQTMLQFYDPQAQWLCHIPELLYKSSSHLGNTTKGAKKKTLFPLLSKELDACANECAWGRARSNAGIP